MMPPAKPAEKRVPAVTRPPFWTAHFRPACIPGGNRNETLRTPSNRSRPLVVPGPGYS